MTKSLSGIVLAALASLTGCTGVPDGLQVVDGFEKSRYLGKWYEIARLDHRFERGLEYVTATYTEKEDGNIRVLNQGYNAEDGAWETAEGTAKFVGSDSQGELKVSFFGPFYGGYNVIRLGDRYDYSVVAGPNRDYLWILARSPSIEQERLERLLKWLQEKDFQTEELIFPEQNEPRPEGEI